MGGEDPTAVFERKLPFDEGQVLVQITPALKRTAGCSGVKIVLLLDENRENNVALEDDGRRGGKVDGLPVTADGAVPGHPTFHFVNVE